MIICERERIIDKKIPTYIIKSICTNLSKYFPESNHGKPSNPLHNFIQCLSIYYPKNKYNFVENIIPKLLLKMLEVKTGALPWFLKYNIYLLKHVLCNILPLNIIKTK